MKTLIIYCSNHGFSEKCASIIKDKLEADTIIQNLKDRGTNNIEKFDTIIIGVSIHAGKIQKKMKQYFISNEEALLKKKVALYLCCMDESKVEEYFKTEIPKKIYNHAIVKTYLGYAFYFEKMNMFIRKIIKKIAKVNQSEENIKYNNIDFLIEKIIS